MANKRVYLIGDFSGASEIYIEVPKAENKSGLKKIDPSNLGDGQPHTFEAKNGKHTTAYTFSTRNGKFSPDVSKGDVDMYQPAEAPKGKRLILRAQKNFEVLDLTT